MWWNKKQQEKALNEWSERLDTEAGGDTTLEMASELRKLRLATLRTPEDFRDALRDNLLSQHHALQHLASSGPSRRGLLASNGVRAIIILWIVAAVLVVGTRHSWQLYLSSKIDGWTYTPPPAYFAPNPSILTDINIWFTSVISQLDPWKFPIIQGTLTAFGSLIVIALVARLFFGLRSRYGSGLISTAYWGSVAAKAIWLSASMAILLILVTLQLTGTQMTNRSSDMSLPSSVRANLEARYAHPSVVRNTARLGLAAGGAMDVNNFRENIRNGYLPQTTDITYEGLFYEYYFDTGEPLPCDQLFCPTYAQAQSRNPLSGEMETFLSVGLTSGMAETEFERKLLNLVVVIDISGSMAESFNLYYYDDASSLPRAQDANGFTIPKLDVAGTAVTAMLDHLEADDRLGIVLFDDDATMAKSLNTMGESDIGQLKRHLAELSTEGGTNLSSGYRMATELLEPVAEADPTIYENRIILLTDAQPNMGELGRDDLAAMAADNADRRIYTTFVGIGVDFNSDLIESMTKMEGANYYSVHAPDEFVKRLDEGFDYMVTPLVFDLRLRFDATDARIRTVYGSPEADAATGELMHVNTLFPSMSEDEAVKGGIVLLKLARTSDVASEVTLTATYGDRSGQTHENRTAVILPPVGEEEQYDHNGIRKGILLARYVDLLKHWLGSEDRDRETTTEEVAGQPDSPLPGVSQRLLGTWERQSSPLNMAENYRRSFSEFTEYFEVEMETIGDESLQQELDFLDELSR